MLSNRSIVRATWALLPGEAVLLPVPALDSPDIRIGVERIVIKFPAATSSGVLAGVGGGAVSCRAGVEGGSIVGIDWCGYIESVLLLGIALVSSRC